VPDQVAHRQGGVAELHSATVLDKLSGRHRDAGRVERVRDGDRSGGGLHLGQRLPVIGVLVRGDDLGDRRVADQLDDPRRLRRRVDQQPLPGLVNQQVHVVLKRAHGELGERHAADFPRVRRPADTYVSCVSHADESIPADVRVS